MLVSIIIPCFNVEGFIGECVASALGQSYPEIEIICIDNNSTDGTWCVLQKLHSQNPNRIKVVQELKKGAPAARNRGLLEAQGEWLQFLDADDLLEANKITHQLRLIKDSSDCAFVAAAYSRELLSGEKIIHTIKEANPLKALFNTHLGITSANLFHKLSLSNINGWKEDLKSSQEYDLMFRLIAAGYKPIIDNLPLTIIRERASGQISQREPVRKWEQYLQLRVQVLEYIKEKHPGYYKMEQDFFMQNLFSLVRVLGRYDLAKANDFFKATFPNNFSPAQGSGFGLYSACFKVLGFKKTEKIYQILKA
jgi:glycosyltransferase involved in cell wall biosynthesis